MVNSAKTAALALAAMGWASDGICSDSVTGERTQFESWFGVTEDCVRISPMPGAVYSDADIAEERALCALDLYSYEVAICPKIWSTSPSVVIYDLVGSRLEGDRLTFQKNVCAGGKTARYVATAELARLKFTMNQPTTSAAYAPAPILYYHFSCYLGTEVEVAPAVWRSMDSEVLLGEVALGGASFTEGTRRAMIHAAWQTIIDTIRDPDNYVQDGTYGTAADLIAAGGTLAYGTLLNATGSGFDEEVNGVDTDIANGPESMKFFRQTPGFLTLQTDAPLASAIEAGVANAVPPVDETMPDGLDPAQVVFWARELSETVLLDFIMSQKDRPGNIDKKAFFYWVEGGALMSVAAQDHAPGDGTVPDDAVRIVEAVLNDNDAAARVEYDNDAKVAGLLEALRHFDAGIYRRLQTLASDMREKGPAWEWLTTAPGLSAAEAEMIASNTITAAEILARSCEDGLLRFDLDARAFLLTGQAAETQVEDCRA